MTEHPVDASTRIIDSGVLDAPVNRMNEELHELGDGVAIVESFSHSIVIDTGAGLVVFDTSTDRNGPKVVESMRSWRSDAVDSIVYTHGHLDHVGGSGAFAADADAAGEVILSLLGFTKGDPTQIRASDMVVLLSALNEIGAREEASALALEAVGYWKASGR